MNVNAILSKLDAASVTATQADARRVLAEEANALRAKAQIAEKAKMLRDRLSAITGTDNQSHAKRSAIVRDLKKCDVNLAEALKEAERVLEMWA